MSAERLVRLERLGPVARLTLNHPPSRNAISGEAMVSALVEALESLDRDENVRALILTGAGTVFSSGGDIKAMAAREGIFAGSPADIAANYRQGIQRIPRAMMALTKPVVAAVNGPAYGAGCDLALMCDIRIAAGSARFAENFVRVGLIPGDGGAWFLPRVVGNARAAEMALTGEPVDAETALAWGLVSRVVPEDRLQSEAQQLAERLAANPPFAVRATKQLLRGSAGSDLDSFLERCAITQGLAHHTEDHAEAVAALLEKRSPRFSGK